MATGKQQYGEQQRATENTNNQNLKIRFMSMIKCPECGRMVSDKAPQCPSCGVEIKGKVEICPSCGEAYFIAEKAKHNCNQKDGQSTAGNMPANPQEPTSNGKEPTDKGRRKGGHTGLIVSLIIAVVITGGALGAYFYSAKQTEESEYEFAFESQDEAVLENYLQRFQDAPEAHRDSIMAHLAILKQGDQEWQDALVNNSKRAFEQYLNNHPDSPHRAEAEHRIDSLDFNTAKLSGTLEAINAYMSAHQDGDFVDEARTLLDAIRTTRLSPDERQMITNQFRKFFQSLSLKDETGLLSTVPRLLTSFLGKQGASQSDVLQFMGKLYKGDITGTTWRLGDDFNIQKQPSEGEDFEYYVTFSVFEQITREDSSKEKQAHYKVSAKVRSSDFLIHDISLTKVVQ